jgi:hypothetical protein
MQDHRRWLTLLFWCAVWTTIVVAAAPVVSYLALQLVMDGAKQLIALDPGLATPADYEEYNDWMYATLYICIFSWPLIWMAGLAAIWLLDQRATRLPDANDQVLSAEWPGGLR